MYEFPVKTFYWALSSEFIFKEMPSLTGQHDAQIDVDSNYFMGTPTAVLSGKAADDEEVKEEVPEN